MNISGAFPSRYLKAADIPSGRPVPVVVRSVEMEAIETEHGSLEDKPILYFMDKTKGLVLNRTNAATLSELYGDETDSWVGQRIDIIATDTTFRGRMVPCLRLRNAETQAETITTPATAPPVIPATAAPSEDIPF